MFYQITNNEKHKIKNKTKNFTYSGPFTKNKESLFKLEIQTLFKKMRSMKLVFSMIWLTANQKI